jgi:hypothetical protein
MTNVISFKIGEQIFNLADLGKDMNGQFLKLYASHYSAQVLDLDNFKREAQSFFDHNKRNFDLHDSFFNNFTIIWRTFLNQGRPKDAEQVWSSALQIAYDWEDRIKGTRLHKGTPYYFWGITCIINGELEKGLLLMHQAFEEDKKTTGTPVPKSAAYSFITLDYDKVEQFFRPKVIEMAQFIEKQLQVYYNIREGTLTLAGFKSKFLQEPSLIEVVFYFVFVLFSLKRLLEEIDKRLRENVFSSLLQTSTIFTLCLILENIIKQKNTTQYSKKPTFYNHLIFLSSKATLNLDEQKTKELNNAFNNNFSDTLNNLLNSRFKYQDSTTPQPIEEDLAVAYGFRNFGAHKIEDQPMVYKTFNEISNRILNSLFFSIEKLYL